MQSYTRKKKPSGYPEIPVALTGFLPVDFTMFFPQCTVSATLNSTGDSTGEQRYANVKLATGLLPVDFTMFFFPVYVEENRVIEE